MGPVDLDGFCVPLVTPLAGGQVAEEDLRALLRRLSEHAGVLFLCGTTGEWNRIGNAERQRSIAVGGEVRRRLREEGGPAQVWAGITALSAQETVLNLAHALDCRVDAAVVAPLAIRGLPGGGDGLVGFFQRDLDGVFESKGRTLPVYLYDNADLAIDPELPHIRTRDVKTLSRLPWIAGIKVSGPRKVLGNYTKAAAHFRDDFRIFTGNPKLAFELFRPRGGPLGRLQEVWIRHVIHDRLPKGIVAGPANLAAELWKRAWKACLAGDAARMRALEEVLEGLSGLFAFGGQGGKPIRKTVACLKEGLRLEGVIRSAEVAPGTAALSAEEAEVFARRYRAWKAAQGLP